MSERGFEVIRFSGARLVKYHGARYPQGRFLAADIYLSLAALDYLTAGYAQIVPRFRPEYPTPQEFADETLADILYRGWQGNIPQEVRDLLKHTRTAVLSAHGNTQKDIGWFVHIEGDTVISTQRLIEKHFTDYETIILAVCNPGGVEPLPIRGTVIYPALNFGIPEETEMRIKRV